MSQPISSEPLGSPEVEAGLAPASAPTKKRSIDVYTVMLCSSLVALMTGCILLYLELQRCRW